MHADRGIEITAIRERFSFFGARWTAAQQVIDLASDATDDNAQRTTHTRALEDVIAQKESALENVVAENVRVRKLEDAIAQSGARVRELEDAIAQSGARVRELEDAIAQSAPEAVSWRTPSRKGTA